MFNVKNKMHVEMARAFNNAVSNQENIQEDGSVNWNFVDADVYMRMSEVSESENMDDVSHYKMFDFLADAYVEANGL